MGKAKNNKSKRKKDEIIPRKVIPQRETIKRRTIDYMKDLGVYKKEYNQLVEVYSDLLFQYNFLTREFEKNGLEVMVETEKSSGKKSPILASLESLRKDILLYSDRLMLNAKAQKEDDSKKGKSPPKPSALSALLQSSGM